MFLLIRMLTNVFITSLSNVLLNYINFIKLRWRMCHIILVDKLQHQRNQIIWLVALFLIDK